MNDELFIYTAEPSKAELQSASFTQLPVLSPNEHALAVTHQRFSRLQIQLPHRHGRRGLLRLSVSIEIISIYSEFALRLLPHRCQKPVAHKNIVRIPQYNNYLFHSPKIDQQVGLQETMAVARA